MSEIVDQLNAESKLPDWRHTLRTGSAHLDDDMQAELGKSTEVLREEVQQYVRTAGILGRQHLLDIVAGIVNETDDPKRSGPREVLVRTSTAKIGPTPMDRS